MLPVLRQFSRDLHKDAKNFCSRRARKPLNTEWLEPAPLEALDGTELAEKLQALRERLQKAEEGVASEAMDNVPEEMSDIAASLEELSGDAMDRSARRLHFSLQQRLAKLQGRFQASWKLARKDEPGVGSRVLADSELLRLSSEQEEAVAYEHSLFLQGRSGTGKTLVLVQRIIHRRERWTSGDVKPKSQLFVTKSQLLRDTVVKQLESANVPVISAPGHQAWPASGKVLCFTWNQLVSHFSMSAAGGCIGFREFEQHIYPQLQRTFNGLLTLSAKAVWTEFSCSLRPFVHWHWNGLSLDEYLKMTVSGQGVHLTPADRRAIHRAFTEYTVIKERMRRKDEIDVAIALRERIRGASRVHEVYVDEVQDFAPTELAALLDICGDRDGFTVAGDTCQTINPGSAFCFVDIMQAHTKIWELRGHKSVEDDTEDGLHVLRYNYRCAPGIRALANSITGLLFSRFPRAADDIQEIDDGLKMRVRPLLLETNHPAEAIAGTLHSRVGTGCLQLDWAIDASSTAVLAKGLEFDLVLIVQLLGKSAHTRAVGSLADPSSEGSQLAVFAASSQEGDIFLQHSQTFYEMAPAIHEFKVLYTAITRAKFGCAILEVNASCSEWSPLLSLWSKEGVVEHLASLDVYNRRVKSGKQCSDLGLDGLDRLASCPVADDASLVSDSSCDITLPEFVAWLEAELEHRQGRDHRRPRALLRSELAKVDDEDFQLNLAFCQEFGERHGFLVEPNFAWKRPAPAAPAPVQMQSGRSVRTARSHEVPADLPALITFMRQHFQRKVLEDLRIPLQEQQEQALQLLMHALDSPLERAEIFKESLQVARRGLALCDMVLQVQLQNSGREEAPRQLWSPVGFAASPDQWRRQLAVLMQDASKPRQKSPLRKLQKIRLWESIFSFLVPESTCMCGHVSLVAEVLEHAVARHALQQILVRSKAGYRLATAASKVDLGSCVTGLEEWKRQMSLHAKRPKWLQWHKHWLAVAELVSCSAEAALGTSGRCTCDRGSEAFHKKGCSCLQKSRLDPLVERKPKTAREHRWKRLTLKLFAGAALEKIAKGPRPPNLPALAVEFRKPLWRITSSDFRSLLQNAEGILEETETSLQRHLARSSQRYIQCSEAGRAFLCAGDSVNAAKALTEAMATAQEILMLGRQHPILLRPRGPVKAEIEALSKPFNPDSCMSASADYASRSGVCYAAALCWADLTESMETGIDVSEAWSQAETAFANMPDAFRAAVCAAQCQRWHDSCFYLSRSDSRSKNAEALLFLCLAAQALFPSR
ncbi:TRANK1 [Symbiodinium necroappetens]|uniref:TRANK1 protein n=1 Tax=Symbiodinium necroappetens TaxID=1628268 RepID=A0A813A7G9_9DINO|nr:TRANK1 [Symbiodinium necroappetens]